MGSIWHDKIYSSLDGSKLSRLEKHLAREDSSFSGGRNFKIEQRLVQKGFLISKWEEFKIEVAFGTGGFPCFQMGRVQNGNNV